MSNGAPYPYEPPPGDGQHTGPGRAPGAGRRRSRTRTLAPLGIAAWVVLEIWLLTVVADAAGALTVLLLLAAGLVLGAVLVRRAGRRAWRQLSSTLSTAAGPVAPGQDAAGRRGGNTLAMLGGLLLMVPGLVSDVAGLLCLFPPTAALLRRVAERRLARGGLGDAVRQARSAGEQSRIHRSDGRTVQGEVVREDDGPDVH